MKKRNYRSINVNQIDWSALKEQLAGKPVCLALDVAKTDQVAELSNLDNSVNQLLKWQHPQQTRFLLTQLSALMCPVVVVVESTSTYGDAMRYQFRQLGFDVHQVSAKRVNDGKEIYDGVPSLHDAKSATIIGRFYREGLTTPWRELTSQERHNASLRKEYEIHNDQYHRNLNRLEAILARHWPELTQSLALNSTTLVALLAEYGSPQEIVRNADKAIMLMQKTGGAFLVQKKIDDTIASARTTLGQHCLASEQQYIKALAQELLHSKAMRNKAKLAMERQVDSDEQLGELAKLVGKVTTAILLSLHLDPRNFDCAQSFVKALGLNLKEKSSGRDKGQLRLTKRGNSKVRMYLYLAALRLLVNDPVVKQWYVRKADPKCKIKTVIALMRKLSKAMWHVARGQPFDAYKLFNIKNLSTSQQ